MKRLVVLTGAGISADSGLKTFRDSGGLWEGYDVQAVASPEGWERDSGLVLRFYNERRRQLAAVEPNAAHRGLAALEEQFDVRIITQNVDNLHERAGSSHVLHLHGLLTSARSSGRDEWRLDIGYRDILPTDRCPWGFPLRPDIVWFGETVPAMGEAEVLARSADIFLVIGTSLNVYPAAGLVWVVPPSVPLLLLDPGEVGIRGRSCTQIRARAAEGMLRLLEAIEGLA